MAKEVRVTFTVLDAIAHRIEKIENRPVDEIAKDAFEAYCKDRRRTDIAKKQLGVNWSVKVYEAILHYCGQGGVSRYIRSCIYTELRKTERSLIEPPDWSETRQEMATRRRVRSTSGRPGYVTQLMLPLQWYEVLALHFPNQVGPWIKAVVQRDLEEKTGVKLPVQRTIREFLKRDE